jgi:hypothetical protein
MEEERLRRDKTGHIPKEKPKRGSYAELRMEELRIERKRYNVDDFGFYRGGGIMMRFIEEKKVI